MKNGVTGLQQLRKLQGRLAQRTKYLSDLNASSHDSGHIGLSNGPVLHQNGENMSAEESALFERDNPEVVAFLESLKFKLNNILREA